MNFKKSIVVIISTLAFGICGFAQSFTNMGKEFWVGYGHHQFMEPSYDNSQNMVLYLCTHEQAAVVTVKIEGSGSPLPPPLGGAWTRTYTIPANTVVSIEDPMPTGVTVVSSPASVSAIGPIPKGATGQGGFDARLVTPPPPFGNGGEGKFVKKGIHITSTEPIVAYAHIYGETSSGATMLMPVETWGYNYISINSAQRNADNAYSWIYVVAKENNTRVVITPSVKTRLSKPAGVPFTVDLQKGEIYQIIGALTDPENGLELTGTTVKSVDNGTGVCYPVAVFAGSSRTGGESDCWQSSGRDNDIQQMFPVEAWGRSYLTAPWSNSDDPSSLMKNMYKVAVKDPLTVVKLNGVPLTGLIGNKYYYFESTTADHIESDQPVMVAQFASGGSPCSTGLGDPEMVYLSPVEQAIKKVGFYRNTKEFIDINYLTMIIPTNGMNTLKIDGTSFSAIPSLNKFSYPHPNMPGYSICIRRWPSAKTQTFVQSDSVFTAITYGLGGAESYAYNAGTYINNLNARTNIHNILDTTRKSHNFTCVDTKVELSLLIGFKPSQINWQMSYVSQINPNPGDLVSGDGTTVMVPEDSVVLDGKFFYKYSVPGNPYIFNTAGSYNIPVSAKNPGSDLCDPFEKFFIDVLVKDKMAADFTITQTGCPADGVEFKGNLTGNGYNINQWFWQFLSGTPGEDSIQQPKYVFPVSDSTYPVKLTSVSEEGCSADTVKNVTVPAGIKTSFTVTPSVCEGVGVQITPGPTTTTEWYWNYGDGKTDTLTVGTPFTHVYSGYGTFVIRHAIKGSGTCTSDTDSSTVIVHAKPFATFTTSPTGCLPADGTVQFKSTAFAADGAVMNPSAYLWDFGNGTSTLADPTHVYTTYGTFPIHYKAVTVNGCAKDTIVNTTFNLRPVVVYAATNLLNVCAGDPAFSVATASVSNGVPGSGIYKGRAITNPVAGIYNPSLAPYGLDTVWYVFTSVGGCIDSAFMKVNVNAKPKPGFTFTTGCLPADGLVNFTNTSAVATGVAMTYKWTFGDVISPPADDTSDAISPSYNYSKEGFYSIKLHADANGCGADTIVTATLSIKPAMAATTVADVCENNVPFALNFGSVTNGIAGTGIYKGPGVANSTSGTFNPLAAGATVAGSPHKLWYVFTTAGGCSDSISQTIVVNAKPHPAFTYTSGCLSTDGLVTFTNGSTILNGADMTYVWNFGDAASTPANNISAAASPTHNYTKEGLYNVTLHADANGCSTDTIVSASVSIKPAMAATAVAGVCENNVPFALKFGSVTNGITGTGIYKGPGVINGVAGTFDPSVAGATVAGSPHNLWYVFTTAGGCSDSISQTIVVNAKPHPAFTHAGACVATNGLVSFTNASTISNGVAMTYSWNFGDAASTPANNTSAAVSPTHNYSKEGLYNVKLQADANGCSTDTIISAAVSIKPAMAAATVAAVCENNVPFALTFGSVTNGITGTGIYKGPGVTNAATGTFDPAVAGATVAGSPHKLCYVFTTAGGCSDSISQTIVVNARPHPAFTFVSGCLPVNGLVAFTNTSTISNGAAMVYKWTFGDAINPPANDTSHAVSPSHSYSREGPYTIILHAEASGCSADTSVTATMSIKPSLAAAPVVSICQNNSPFELSFGSVINNVIGSYIYKGAGITDLATGTFDPSVAGATATGSPHQLWYVFTTQGGCTDSISATVSVFPVPVADFAINRNVSNNICLDSAALIEDRSVVSGGTIKSWNWSFSNGEVYPPSLNNTAFYKYFALAGSTDVNLFVVSDSGCTSATVTKTINIRPLPVADFATASAVCMPGGVANFTNLSSIPDQTSLSYLWTFGDNTPSLNTVTPQHIYNSSLGQASITLLATSPYGCVSDTTKTIAFYSKPIVDFSAEPDTLCQGAQNTFTDLSVAPNSSIISHNWTFSDGSAPSSATNPTITFANPGDFIVRLSVATREGCAADTSKAVKVYLQPKIDAGPSFLVAEGDTVTFNPVVNSSNLTFLWTPPAGLNNATLLRPTTKATITQTYTLTATGQGNCRASDTLTLRVTRPVKIPNAFSPNGDGVNDSWVITHLDDYPNSVVEVFNRYGQSVFVVNGGYPKPWDGTYKGSALPVGTYYYIINLKDGSKPYTGYVAIIK